ncbi:TetR/AcrR family transcriptional regulator C-terminal domain-containing protein [Spirillospora sp. NPDC047279]|uniref:TetR/AcrR family transcriptional regulator C-terminal domain-containing protein n=1 Tax=Spirillospora sp. NPDC047279 TaxID=3155478 RepID=UPI0033EB04D5
MTAAPTPSGARSHPGLERGVAADDPRVPSFRDLLASGEFPHLEDVFKRGIMGGQHFAQGLTWLLDGIERQYG